MRAELQRPSRSALSASTKSTGNKVPAPQTSEPVEPDSASRDSRKVWVVYGRNAAARTAMFQFMRAINLDPMEWNEATALAQVGAPYIGQVLDRAFSEVQAVVVLLTGDDLARLRPEFLTQHDPPYEATETPQGRPNVLFEAGMAFGRHPERTVLVTLGYTRPFSDVVGRHMIRISNSVADRQALAARLMAVGCSVVTETRTDWHSAGDFDAALPKTDGHHEEDTDEEDLKFFLALRQGMRDHGGNVWTPPLGSGEDKLAERLVQRGWLGRAHGGGYRVLRFN